MRTIGVIGLINVALLSAKLALAGGERFDFVATSGTLGFGQPHNVEFAAQSGKPLLVRSTGKDPFFHSPPVSLRATTHGALVIRAAFEGPVRHLSLYFATDKSPNIGQDKVLMVPVRADGKEYEYRLPVGQHPLWRGTVTRYRFDLEPGAGPGAVMRLSSLAYTYPAEPTLNTFTASASVLAKGTTVALTVEIENTTPDALGDVEVRFQPSTNTVSISPAKVAIARLAPDEQMDVQAMVRGERDGVAVLDAIMLRKGVELDRRNVALCVATDMPPSNGVSFGTIQIRPGGQPWAAVTNNQSLVVRLDGLSGLAEWWAGYKGRYVRVGRIFPMVSLLHGERERHLEIVRWHSCEKDSSGGLTLVGDLGPRGQEMAGVEMQVWPQPAWPFWTWVDVKLQAKRPIHLRAFTAPRLLVGDGAFGSERDEGLLPGVEYLEKGEHSSSKLDYHTDESLRTVPHPKKFTFPFMAVTHGDHLLTLSWTWTRNEPQGEGQGAPSAGFASPNFVDGQKNHLMTLFWPPVPDLVSENHWEARKPVLVNPGERLTLHYRLHALTRPGIHVTDVYPILFQGMMEQSPRLQEPPRDYDAECALCRVAYADVVWREKERGWNHALPASPTQWAPHPYTFNVQFLEAERAEMTSSPERNRISQIIEQATSHRWKIGGERPSGEDYYFVGETLLACVEARQAQARTLMKQQRTDGSWGFESRDEKQAELGPKGQAEVGIVADHAIPILQHALMTGDREAEASARKALEHMKRYVIPRAAQVWEIPVHTPDIMGSARGATAYRLGYLLTGETDHLARAKYWLSTGLPFIYFWSHPSSPYWRFATIPVFGATHFRAPNWEGLPVQWCGLVYAEEALRYAQLKSDPVYRNTGEGILRSAMWQQPTDGEYRGLLPDSYPLAARQGNGPFINPETILRPLWLLRGFDFRVNTIVLPRGNDRSLRLSALAGIATATVTSDYSVRANLGAVRGLPFGVVVCGLDGVPQDIKWHGQPLPKRDKLERTQEGWIYLADRGWLLANLVGTGKGDQVIVKLADKK